MPPRSFPNELLKPRCALPSFVPRIRVTQPVSAYIILPAARCRIPVKEALRATVKGDEPSEIFELEAEHYCPDCGKTRWVHFDLDDEMYYKSPRGWISVTGESSEVLED